MTGAVHDDPRKSRYELAVEGGTAIAAYRREGDMLVLTHTEVPAALEGQGVGGRLVAGVLDDARARGLRVRPLCSFVRGFIERHPDYSDLVAQ